MDPDGNMAFGVHPDRTLLVRNVVRIDGTQGPLRDIARRLDTAGCDVDTSGDDGASAMCSLTIFG
jgi:hypothetical protein